MRFVHLKKYCAFLPTVVVFPYTRLQSDQSFMQEFVSSPCVHLKKRQPSEQMAVFVRYHNRFSEITRIVYRRRTYGFSIYKDQIACPPSGPCPSRSRRRPCRRVLRLKRSLTHNTPPRSIALVGHFLFVYPPDNISLRLFVWICTLGISTRALLRCIRRWE